MSKKNEPPVLDKTKKLSRWYFGGVASAGAACITHPLDLLKVHLQTQQEVKTGLVQATMNVIKKQGILGLYNGLSASLLRQLTYSMVRYGAYEVGKTKIETPGNPAPFYQKFLLAGMTGAAGGIVGTPSDLINVRMQNDVKLPVEKRRNYTWAVNGLIRVYKEEGFRTLFNGCSTATARAAVMTMGQLSFYDQIKLTLLKTPYFEDNPKTHFTASLAASTVATTMTQPLDVLKTRAMNAKPGEFKGLMDIILYTAKLGPLAFFKGFLPAFIRLAPHTVLTFLFLERMRLELGYFPAEKK